MKMSFRYACFAVAVTRTRAFTAPLRVATRSLSTTSTEESDTALHGLRFWKKNKADITEGEVRDLFSLWNNALATKDSRIVAKRYAKDPILLPTVSDTPRTDFDSIKDYFDAFLKLEPQGKIDEGKITIGENWANDAGIYTFNMGANGAEVKARYTFLYVKEGGNWKIAHHHSSAMPETKGKKITPGEVKGLFHLWNDALATLDPDVVAKRYSKQGVLLPTVSDQPRTNYAEIKDYFTAFCKKQPQGTILESFVTVGDNWCRDAGIYEFTMGADGSKVKARYSFVYVFEDGEWKISHHHSSVMPEAFLNAAPAAPSISKSEASQLFYKWNDALATLEPAQVAARYSKEAVLLATVSDQPRTNAVAITDYFVGFLKKKPQGVILESYPIVGNGWCEDVGIYEFTMGADGSKVKARYSFVYVYEDGEWKIAHHHSSIMPEAALAALSEVAEKETVSQ